MRKTLRKKLFKSVLWFSLFVFLPFAFGFDAYAQAKDLKEEVQSKKINVILNSIKDKDFDEILNKAEEILEKDFSDDLRKDAFRTILSGLKERDEEIRKRFAQTEKKLRRKDLPPEILKRHKEFVEKYEERFKKFEGRVNSYTNSNWLTRSFSRNGLKGFIEENTYERKIPEFDPNKLPHRSKPTKQIQTEEYKPPEKKELKKIEKQGAIQQGNSLEGIGYSENIDTLNTIPNTLTDELFAYAGDISMLPLLVSQGGDGYLSETMEVQFTEEIQELAEELEHKPVEIYEHLRNNFKYEPYYGSLKGAQQTLFEGAGNDFDLASLLISLLRTSGIKSRYVYGEIIIPIDAVMSWLGVRDPWVAGNILVTNGVPAVMRTVGGEPHSIRMKHCWVEAYIPWMGGKVYRGAYDPDDIGSAKWLWCPMDVSFKEQWYFERIDVSNVPFNESEYLDTLRETPFDYYFKSIQNYIEENYPDSSIAHGFSGSAIKSFYPGYIPGTLPYEVKKDERNRFAEIADSYRHKVRFEVVNAYGMTDISYTVSLPELAGKSVSLFYAPATASDEATIESYGGLYKTPAYLINLKPQFRIDNEITATGEAIGFGKTQTATMTFIAPGFGEIDRVNNEFISGAWYGIIFDYQNVGEKGRIKHLDNLINLLDLVDFSDTTGTFVPEPFWAEEFLNSFGLSYFSLLDVSNKLLRRCLRVVSTRDPSEVISGFDVSVSNLLGMPYGVELTGLFNDADRLSESVFSIYNDKSKEIKYTVLSGYESSFLEHYMIELWLNSPAISAVKALQLASLEGLDIYDIDKSNINTILPELTISDEAKEEIANGVNAGNNAKVSQSNVSIEDWTGVGYIISDPATGSACYKISGGYNGSVGTHAGMMKSNYAPIGPGLIEYAYVWSGGGKDSKFATADQEEISFDAETLLAYYHLVRFYRNTQTIFQGSAWELVKVLENPCIKAFVYCGHGTVSTITDPVSGEEVKKYGLSINRKEWVSFESISGFFVDPLLTFVFLSACHGGRGLGSFPLSSKGASVGYSKAVHPDPTLEFSYRLLSYLSTGITLSAAIEILSSKYPNLILELTPIYLGNMSMKLGDDEECLKK